MKKILILYGGKSFEHEISCLSANNVCNSLKKMNYCFDKVYISKENKWFLIKDNNKVELLNIIDFIKKYDVVFPVMHGAYGEDGHIQSFLELFNIKYVGSNSVPSMIAMDKYLTKVLVSTSSIKQIPYFVLYKNEKIPTNIEYPVIIKPANGGSSIGINVAHSLKELKNYVKEAFKYDSKIVIEKFIKGRELECGILEDKKLIVGDVGEIKYDHEFYDFNAKYKEKSNLIIPAKISKSLTKKIQEETIKIFKILNLKDFARIDFIYDETNDILYFNEVNTIPGFTDISMFPLIFKNKNLNFEKLIIKILEK